MLAVRLGLSQTDALRIWRASVLVPCRTERFKLSADTHFVDKVRDMVGLCLHPFKCVLVLCVDEKPSIQASTDTAPAYPTRPGQLERYTHDYIRRGTNDLFAALDVKYNRTIAREVSVGSYGQSQTVIRQTRTAASSLQQSLGRAVRQQLALEGHRMGGSQRQMMCSSLPIDPTRPWRRQPTFVVKLRFPVRDRDSHRRARLDL